MALFGHHGEMQILLAHILMFKNQCLNFVNENGPLFAYSLSRAGGEEMLRIDLLSTAVLRMSGRLAEGSREEVEAFVGSHEPLPNLVVDLSEVTYIDRGGEDLLSWLGRRGARFAADSTYAHHVCERLRLSMSDLPGASGRAQDTLEGTRNE